jgi:SAM-dependent methyltransferase
MAIPFDVSMLQPEVIRTIRDYIASDDPLPYGTSHVIGDGDFRLIGAEFLRHMVVIGGLKPHHNVLDAGCGFGRMAMPLSRYLAPGSRYLGFDIVAEPIDWCRQKITARNTAMEFAYVGMKHELYTPQGQLPSSEGFRSRLPVLQDWRPDFAAAVSLFTHLETETFIRYLQDFQAVLTPDGTLFMTTFLVDKGAPAAAAECAFPVRQWRQYGVQTGLRGEPLTAAVGVPVDWFLAQCSAAGLEVEQVHFGRWRRSNQNSILPYQDIVICRKPFQA